MRAESALAGQHLDKIFLVRLPEGEPVQQALLFHPMQPVPLLARRHVEHIPLDGPALAHPPRCQPRRVAHRLVGQRLDPLPRTLMWPALTEGVAVDLLRDRPPDRKAPESL